MSFEVNQGPPARPRAAATVLLLRDADAGPEVLMLRRHARSGFAANAWVFPGGTVDEADCALHPAHWTGVDPTVLTGRFDADPALVLGFHVAAVREAFEEAGLLLARHPDGTDPDIDAPDYVRMRSALGDRSTPADFNGWLAEEDLVLDLGLLVYLSRWVTPVMEKRRFDTCFFLARAPEHQVARHDAVETTDQRWITAAEALERAQGEDFVLFPPTLHTLRELAGYSAVDAWLDHAGGQQRIPRIQPHIELLDGGGWRALLPDDEDFPHDLYAPGGPLAEVPAAGGDA